MVKVQLSNGKIQEWSQTRISHGFILESGKKSLTVLYTHSADRTKAMIVLTTSDGEQKIIAKANCKKDSHQQWIENEVNKYLVSQ